jgi:hypothetical protein
MRDRPIREVGLADRLDAAGLPSPPANGIAAALAETAGLF